MPPTPKDLAKYARVAALYHDPAAGLSQRALAARYRVSQATIGNWLRAVGQPPRPHGTHGPAEVARLKRQRVQTLARMARQAAKRAQDAAKGAR